MVSFKLMKRVYHNRLLENAETMNTKKNVALIVLDTIQLHNFQTSNRFFFSRCYSTVSINRRGAISCKIFGFYAASL